MDITARTRLLCVLGCPVEHSVSPEMQNAALRVAGVPIVYAAFRVTPEYLGSALAGLQALGFVGANLTIPHKEAGAQMMDRLSPEAAALGAVNTVIFSADGMVGHNTDVCGFLEPLRREGIDPAGKKAVVLGAGGAARAVVYGLSREGASVTIVNRTAERARVLADITAATLSPGKQARAPMALASGSSEAEDAVRGCDLLVNATSAGMAPNVEELPPIKTDWLRRETVVIDLIYRPRVTALLRAAMDRGCRTMNGLGMLVHQGAESLRLWLGIEADVTAMERAALNALRDS